MTAICITIYPFECTTDSKGLARFEVDPAVATLTDVAVRIRADPMLSCYDEAAHANLTLSTFEDGAMGAPIGLADPAVCRQPLSAVIPHLAPRAAESGLTAFADGYELCLAVNVMEEAPLECGADVGYSCDKSEQVETIGTRQQVQQVRELHDAWRNKALFAACSNGELNIAVSLVRELGVDVNATDNDEWTPLHFAAFGGHHEVIRVLVKELGSDVGAKTLEGRTPLHLAAQCGHDEVVRVLLEELGADVHAKDGNGFTSLHLAASNNNLDVMCVLVKEFAADLCAKDSDGCAPLDLAACSGHHKAVRVLGGELGAKVSFPGWVPLHFSASNGHVEAIRVLVDELGADVDASADGYTALDMATANDHHDAIRLLKEFGAT